MDLIEIFELSQTSRHMFSKIKMAKKKILPIKFHISEGIRRIQISDYKIKEGQWGNFKLNFCFQEKLRAVRRQVHFNQFDVGICYKGERFEEFPGYFAPLRDDALFPCLDYLFELFSCSELFLSIESTMIFKRFLANPVMLKCSTVLIFETNRTILSDKKLRTVLRHTRPTFGVSLKCHTTENIGRKEILKLPLFYASHATWLTVSHLFSLKCEKAFFDEHNLTEEDLREFIKHYVAGHFPKLQQLRIGKFKTGPVWENLLKDVKYGKWDERKRARRYITHSKHRIWETDCKEAWDFETNERLVSVMQDSEHFHFLVWKDRFPVSMIN